MSTMTKTTLPALLIIVFSSLIFSACGPQKPKVSFSDDDQLAETTPYVDKFATEKINITKTVPLNQEFTVKYKYFQPDGVGSAQFKAKSIKEVKEVASRQPSEGKKLILVEIAIRGNAKNLGQPSNFNQIGDTPSPQFVIIDQAKNLSTVETTYFSESYTQSKNLFELSKITLDHEQWVNTAIVFEIDNSQEPSLALRFINPEGVTEFYAIK